MHPLDRGISVQQRWSEWNWKDEGPASARD